MPSIPQRRLLSWKSPVHTSFSQFLLSNEAKNAYRMSLGCLQNALLARSTSSRTTCLRQTRLVMSPSTCGASRSQRKRICHTQPGKPLGIGTRSDREISKNYLQTRHAQFVLASLQPYILTTLHYYVFIFPLRHFGLSQSSKQHPKKRSKVWRRRGLPFVERTKKMAWEVFSKS